jgi:ferredoxin-nitrite reductase
VGIIPAPSEDGRPRYDLWVAGGLGREPTPGYLLVQGVLEESLLPYLETIVRLYRENTPPPRRLKYFVRQIGQDAFRDLVLADPAIQEELTSTPSFSASLVPVLAAGARRVEASVFAGELTARGLASLAEIAGRHCGGILMITGDQNVSLHPETGSDPAGLQQALREAGFAGDGPRDGVTFRVCPGDHECIMGLAPTRDVAGGLLDAMGPAARALTWAISGCPNCCAQPQLSQAGVVATRLTNDAEERSPRFDLYRAGSGPFAEPVQQGLTLEELTEAVKNLEA